MQSIFYGFIRNFIFKKIEKRNKIFDQIRSTIKSPAIFRLEERLMFAAINFDFDTAVTGGGTKVLTQAKSGETVVLTSSLNNLYNDLAADWGVIGSGSIAGMSLLSALNESQIVITVQGGKSFDLSSLDIYSDNNDTLVLTTSKG